MSKTLYEIHEKYVELLKQRGEEVVQPKGKTMNHIDGYDKTVGLKSAGTIFHSDRHKDDEFELLQDICITGNTVKWSNLGLCDARCLYEALDEKFNNETKKCNFRTERELKDLVIHSMKELGEIAECLVKKDRPEHWKNELGDLCAFGIKPMLKIAELGFDDAVDIGLERRYKKMRDRKMEVE